MSHYPCCRNPESSDGIRFADGLSEHCVSLMQQPDEWRRSVLAACDVVWVGCIAEVQKRSEQERNAVSVSKPQCADGRKGMWEGERVNGIHRSRLASRITPHAGAGGVGGPCEALPPTMRHDGQRFQQIPAAWETERAISADTIRFTGFDLCIPSPCHGLVIDCRAGPHCYRVAACDQIPTEPFDVALGATHGRRIAVDKVVDVQTRSPAAG